MRKWENGNEKMGMKKWEWENGNEKMGMGKWE